jgi:hypothetical protein
MTDPFATGTAGSARQHTTLKEFPEYEGAQRLVDKLSDAGFPVQHLRIVGLDIRTVEQVTGRMTTGKAALVGAASGAWFGLLIGLIFGLFTAAAAWLGLLLGAVALGIGWGAIFGAIAHWATRGRRDFSSVKRLEADRYAVMVDAEHAAEAGRVAALP